MESDIAPYKGLLMGLFFMTVGMEISVGLFFGRFKTVVAGILGLLVGKVTCDSLLTCQNIDRHSGPSCWQGNLQPTAPVSKYRSAWHLRDGL